MDGNENKSVEALFAEVVRDYAAKTPKTTVFELMKTIYNFMSECYTTGELLEKTRAIKVLADSICKELIEDLEGLEP